MTGDALPLFTRLPALKILIILLSMLAGTLFADMPSPIRIDKTPAWIVPKALSLPEQIPTHELDGGVYYLLSDSQIRVEQDEETEQYAHYAELVVNQEGLEEVSPVNIDYDPSYQTITLNTLRIHRDGHIIDKTKTATISLLRRESGLEEQMYDGHLTANIIVDDVRVGDIVEYSYTRTGTNPIYKGMFDYDRYVQWDIPVHVQNIRVLWNRPNPLHVKTLHTDAIVKEEILGRFKTYTLESDDAAPLRIDSQVPEWYQPYGAVYFYEADGWGQIAAWAVSLYDGATGGSDAIDRIAETIAEHADTQEAQVAAALAYVQSNIRYLGIEMGTSSMPR